MRVRSRTSPNKHSRLHCTCVNDECQDSSIFTLCDQPQQQNKKQCPLNASVCLSSSPSLPIAPTILPTTAALHSAVSDSTRNPYFTSLLHTMHRNTFTSVLVCFLALLSLTAAQSACSSTVPCADSSLCCSPAVGLPGTSATPECALSLHTPLTNNCRLV